MLKQAFLNHGSLDGINWALSLVTLALGYKVFISAVKEKGFAKKLGIFVATAIVLLSLGGLFYIGAKNICRALKGYQLNKTYSGFCPFKEMSVEIPAKE